MVILLKLLHILSAVSEIADTTPTVWESNPQLVVSIVALAVTIILLIAGTCIVFITNQKHNKQNDKLQNELSIEKSTLESILNAIPEFIFCKDMDFKYTRCNKKMQDFFGIHEADLIGKDYEVALNASPEMALMSNKADQEALREGRLVVYEETVPSADGTPTLCETMKAPIIQNGEIVGLIGVARDITERKAMEEAAQAASRAKSDFLSHMSLEIRTPLNAIIGMINIAMSTEDIDKKNYCLKRADSASIHLLGIINDVLDMSKIEAEKFELSYGEVCFEEMLTNVTNLANVRAEEKQQTFIVNLSKNVPVYVETDELRLSQVIMNLLTNAIKFTPEKGLVNLNIIMTDERCGEVTLRVEVTDTGIGISKEQQALLFESFSQADAGISKKYGGTGLGLAISKRIVELMGGEIWFESELGKGSKFMFTIKVKKLIKKPFTKLPADMKPEDIRILAIDDSEEEREYIIRVMDSLNLRCDVAASGAEAVHLIKNARGKQYNIFFVDRQIHSMDGIELVRRIKEISKDNSWVIMISSDDWAPIEKEAAAAGVNHFVLRPLSPSTLVNAINYSLKEDQNGSTNTVPVIQTKKNHNFAGHNILIAEDVDINREIMSSVLEDTQISIDFAENGKIAVAMFSKNQDKYSLILMDVNMPEMDGYEATQRIRALGTKQSESIPIVAMTANVFREDIEKCIESGMDDHTGKPVDVDAICGLLNKYLKNPDRVNALESVHKLKHGIAWDDGLLTGNALVDMQHQRIFKRLSDLVQACEDGSDIEKLQDTLGYLVNHTVRHFVDEEALLIEHEYPDYEFHKNEHEAFRDEVTDLVRRFKASGSSAKLSNDVNKSVVRWLVNHIQTEDKIVSEYIRKKTV